MKTVLIGAGQAALQTIVSLRQQGYEGDIHLIGDEPFIPYQRPPLSKAYLLGELERDRLFLKPEKFFDEQNVTMHLEKTVTSIDPEAKTIAGDDGFALDYDKLVIATGSRPRILDLPGRQLKYIFDLRGMSDIDAMMPHFQAGKKLAIIGGGYIGLEAAAVGRKMGLDVTVLEAAPRLLARVAEPELSAYFTRLHEGHGVEIKTDTSIVGFTESTSEAGCVGGIEFADGSILDADMVITGIGILPNIEIAAEAGLDIENGIVVDDLGRTSVADIYAAGDCTYHPNDLLKRKLRLESVPNAIEQGKAVASDIVGKPQPYHQVPWFWSDQYDVKLQIVGVPERVDHKVLRGDDTTNSFAWFYFTDGKLTGVTAVNRMAEFMAGKQLILKACSEGHKISPEQLVDEESKPKSWLA
jgi:3-phenylpropionate/trans-cinnamate dioxygenase ferredoxin reductase subunit